MNSSNSVVRFHNGVCPSRLSGFMLLELLVALFVLSLLGALALRGLQVLSAVEVAIATSHSPHEVQKVLLMIERDLVTSQRVNVTSGTEAAASDDGLVVYLAGKTVVYRVRDGALWRSQRRMQGGETQQAAVRLLAGVSEFVVLPGEPGSVTRLRLSQMGGALKDKASSGPVPGSSGQSLLALRQADEVAAAISGDISVRLVHRELGRIEKNMSAGLMRIGGE